MNIVRIRARVAHAAVAALIAIGAAPAPGIASAHPTRDRAPGYVNPVTAGVTSPRIYLYLACSRAALALLADPARQGPLVQDARRHYTLARPAQNDFNRDRRFISPRVLELLTGG